MEETTCAECGQVCKGLYGLQVHRRRAHGLDALVFECAVTTCTDRAINNSMCGPHAAQARQGKELPGVVLGDPPHGLCVSGCGRWANGAHGLCSMHYKRSKRRNGDIGGAETERPPDRRCTVEGCDEPHYGTGWCQQHWSHARNHGGDPLGGVFHAPRGLTLGERLAWNTDVRGPNECWLWTGGTGNQGYGAFKFGGRQRSAHVWAWINATGIVPPVGMVIDHTCHNGSGCPGGNDCPHRACVNARHLEMVTLAENILRGEGPPAKNARKARG